MQSERQPPPVVTVAHQYGSGGAAIAAHTAERLGVRLYDRALIERIVADTRSPLEIAEILSAHQRDRVEEYLAKLLRSRSFDPSDCFESITRTVCSLWESGPCVMVGHGCVHIIPRARALAVRVIAPVAVRVARVAAREGLSAEQAERLVERTDAERAAFHMLYYGADINDVESYDMMLDSSGFAMVDAAGLIADAYRVKLRTP